MIAVFGLPGIFVLMFLEGACIPIPSQATMMGLELAVTHGGVDPARPCRAPPFSEDDDHRHQRADYEAWVQRGRQRLRLFAAPLLSPSRQDLLRQRGVPFFDVAGSVWIAAASPTWFRRCVHDLAAAFETPASPGIGALLHQRPGRVCPGVDDGQFRQYAWSMMQGLLGLTRQGRSSRAP